MKIAVLCIATNFKVRMKIGNKALLKQEEKTYMSKVLKELELWVHHSKEELVPIIITCFDEIYEMATQKHFLAFNNEFGFLSEGHVIRFGISSYPDADAYFILSTSETRILQAEIFETLCEHRRNNPNKIVIARVNDKLTLPMVFSNQFIEPIHTIVDRENGKFVLRSNSKNAIYLDITEEMIKDSDFHKKADRPEREKGNGNSTGNGNDPGIRNNADSLTDGDLSGRTHHEAINQVVVIRGGGRIATSIAITLYQFGYCVLITETQSPSTIYRGMSFAQAVFTSETEVEGIKAYLVSPSQIQIQKAWNAKAIPVIIDPDAEVLQLFDQTSVVKSLFNENFNEKPGMDIINYLKNEKERANHPVQPAQNGGINRQGENQPESDSIFSRYPLLALIDATTSKNQKQTNRTMAPVTIGLREDQQPKEDVLVKIETKTNSRYGKILFRREILVSHILSDESETSSGDTGSSGSDETQAEIGGRAALAQSQSPCGFAVILYSLEEGKYKEIRKIGDAVEEGTVIGLITKEDGSQTDVTAPIKGRLIGHAASNSFYTKNSEIAAIDSSILMREECFQLFPIDKTVAYSVLSLLKGKI